MKTHFYPYANSDEGIEQAPCGTWMGEASDLTSNWARVDCKSCINRKDKLISAREAEENAIVAQMGDMAKHMQAGGES